MMKTVKNVLNLIMKYTFKVEEFGRVSMGMYLMPVCLSIIVLNVKLRVYNLIMLFKIQNSIFIFE